MGQIPNLKTDHKAGQSLKSVSASDLNAIARFINEFEGAGALIVVKGADGSGSYAAVWMSEDDFQFRGSDNVVQTNGATGTTLNGDVVVNGLIKSIGT